jgi:hypothetical protein
MTIVELFPADIYNQKTIQQGHPPDWINRDGARRPCSHWLISSN